MNCAGIIELGSIENTSLDQYDRLFNVNVRYCIAVILQYICTLLKLNYNKNYDMNRLSQFTNENLLYNFMCILLAYLYICSVIHVLHSPYKNLHVFSNITFCLFKRHHCVFYLEKFEQIQMGYSRW